MCFIVVYRIGISSKQRFLGWNVPPEELPTIPEHWLTQPEPEVSMHLLLAILYCGFFVFALLGNGAVLWVFIWFVRYWLI